MAKSFHHLKTHTHDEAEGQQIEMIAHPGGDGDHVRLAASQCCGGSERVWRGGAKQGTSTTAQRPAPSRPRPCRSSRLWRGGQKCRRLHAAKEKVLRPTRARLWASTSRQRTERWGQACFFAAFVRTAADQVHSRTCMRCSLSSFLSFLRDPVRKH